ncbi:MAG TPA: isocitrate lyase/PEP mutase family protein [Candidatus Binatia bacterium]|nr:isocitrate lyase/PEP mutase family protein [Candidatus Binatia bacterium]
MMEFKLVWSSGSDFPLIHISGSGQHRALGFADAGLLTLTEMINRAREIADAVNIPIVSDAETGYGNAVNVVRAVREFERAGVAAIHIEDQMTPKRAGHEGFDVGLVSKAEFVAKIKAAVDTRRDENLIIIARSEAKDSLQERLDRTQACIEAGADAAWVSARTEDEIKAYAELGKPMVGVPPRQVMPLQRWGELGGRVGCIPTVLQVAALHGMRQCLEELKKSAPKRATSRKRQVSKIRANGTLVWATRNSKSSKPSTVIDTRVSRIRAHR